MTFAPPSGETMRAHLAAHAEARRKDGDARALAIAESLSALAEVLRGLGARRAWVFGSVARGEVDDQSDLDIAVEGLDPRRFIEARVALSERCPVELDLVEVERAPSALRAAILSEGRELFRAS